MNAQIAGMTANSREKEFVSFSIRCRIIERKEREIPGQSVWFRRTDSDFARHCPVKSDG
jgi:hypothetical protein